MMVDDDAPFCHGKELRIDSHIRPTRIDDKEQGLFITDKFCIFCTNHQIFKFRDMTNLFFNLTNRISLFTYDDMTRFASNAGHVGNAYSSTDAIIIFPLVSHDENEIARIDKLTDSLGDDAGPDTRILSTERVLPP